MSQKERAQPCAADLVCVRVRAMQVRAVAASMAATAAEQKGPRGVGRGRQRRQRGRREDGWQTAGAQLARS